jgi:hypothetical protein
MLMALDRCSEGMPELVVGFLEQRDDGRHAAGLLEVLTIFGLRGLCCRSG